MMNMLAIFGLGTPEIIAILVIVFLLFGAKKLPEFARGLGKSLGEFKKAKSEFEEELLKTEKETMSDVSSSSKTELRTSPGLSQPIDVEVEKAADSKPDGK
ncbi:twin-arginine translocase TatA/TatE family subunit [Akkermansia sp.]|uniref:twin-arginine translocase TatA/TatE family subunit n=1 Tax=Akkermansia sp. TaxID=1872421 RepID=UPI003AB632D3